MGWNSDRIDLPSFDQLIQCLLVDSQVLLRLCFRHPRRACYGNRGTAGNRSESVVAPPHSQPAGILLIPSKTRTRLPSKWGTRRTSRSTMQALPVPPRGVFQLLPLARFSSHWSAQESRIKNLCRFVPAPTGAAFIRPSRISRDKSDLLTPRRRACVPKSRMGSTSSTRCFWTRTLLLLSIKWERTRDVGALLGRRSECFRKLIGVRL